MDVHEVFIMGPRETNSGPQPPSKSALLLVFLLNVPDAYSIRISGSL